MSKGPGDRHDGGRGGDAPPAPADTPHTDALNDWITIWQSELSALATDQEMQQAWSTLVGMWATGARAAAALLPPALHQPSPPDGSPRRPRPKPPARPAPIAAASDAGQPETDRGIIERLARRVEELERRLAELDGTEP